MCGFNVLYIGSNPFSMKSVLFLVLCLPVQFLTGLYQWRTDGRSVRVDFQLQEGLKPTALNLDFERCIKLCLHHKDLIIWFIFLSAIAEAFWFREIIVCSINYDIFLFCFICKVTMFLMLCEVWAIKLTQTLEPTDRPNRQLEHRIGCMQTGGQNTNNFPLMM